MSELDRLDRLHGLGAPLGSSPPGRRRRRALPAPLAGLLVTGLVLGLLAALAPGEEWRALRRLVGLGPDRSSTSVDFEPGTGTFAFLMTQRGSGEPVGYDPCRPVEYVVNPAGAPEGWEDLVESSVARTEAATGLSFRYRGTTEERPFNPLVRGPFSGSRRPAVIGFADEEEIADLAGDVAGLGGSLAVRDGVGRDYYVTGSVALDVAVFDDARMGRDRAALEAILDHELGHLVGLDHVEDPGELMFEQNFGRTGYGPGDLEGLARLGAIECA